MHIRRWGSAAALLLIACALARPAYADGGDKVAAQRWYGEGKRLYDVGDYGKALDAFKSAYLAYEEPTFLFNMAQCQRALGNKPEAIRSYKSYLRNQADAPNRQEVDRVIAQLQAQLDAERAAAAPPPPPRPELTAPPPTTTTVTAAAPPRKSRHLWWIWPVAGVVVAGAAVGLALGLTLGRPSETTLTKVQY